MKERERYIQSGIEVRRRETEGDPEQTDPFVIETTCLPCLPQCVFLQADLYRDQNAATCQGKPRHTHTHTPFHTPPTHTHTSTHRGVGEVTTFSEHTRFGLTEWVSETYTAVTVGFLF